MLEQQIAQHFYEHADLLSHTAAPLSKPVALASHMLLGCVTSGGKVMFFGHEGAAPLADLGARLLAGRFERERPPLAALALNAVNPGNEADALRALGVPGDVLVIVSAAQRGSMLSSLMRAAADKEVGVIALTGPQSPDIDVALTDTDVQIAVNHERRARVFETHAVVLHALADALDTQLLGEQETP